MAAQAYGLYAGANKAIRDAQDRSSDAATMADQIRQQLASMTIIRCFAVLDRSAHLSFQTVYRGLKDMPAVERASLPSHALKRFTAAYGTLKFGILGAMQSFRNNAIAHVSWEETQRFITYGDLKELVEICCELSHALNLLTSGLNNPPIEHLDGSREASFEFWTAALRDNTNPFTVAPPV